jgi:hypothetical protein
MSALTIADAINEDCCCRWLSTVQQLQWRLLTAAKAVVMKVWCTRMWDKK